MKPHAHSFDSDHFYIPGTLITSTIFACKCGALASVGEGKPSIIWEPGRAA